MYFLAKKGHQIHNPEHNRQKLGFIALVVGLNYEKLWTRDLCIIMSLATFRFNWQYNVLTIQEYDSLLSYFCCQSVKRWPVLYYCIQNKDSFFCCFIFLFSIYYLHFLLNCNSMKISRNDFNNMLKIVTGFLS